MATRKSPSAQTTRRQHPQRVYEQLRHLIVTGRMAPGSRLVETDIAARFEVSRTPVRGALQRLQQEGYIIDSPSMRQSRPLVAPLTKEDVTELFQIVGQLEALAAHRAAELPAAERQALTREMSRLNAEFKQMAKATRTDHNRLYELDEQFHRAAVDAAAGPRLRALHDAVKPQAERYERLYVSFVTGELMDSAREHDDIIAALDRGDPTAAEQAVQHNWRSAATRLSRIIEVTGERGRW